MTTLETNPNVGTAPAPITTDLLHAGELAGAFADALLFTSKDQARPILCAVRIVGNGAELELCATDSYRLGWRTLPSAITGTAYVSRDELGAIVKHLTAYAKSHRGCGDTGADLVTLTLNEDKSLTVVAGALSVTTPAWDSGDFPNVESLDTNNNEDEDGAGAFGVNPTFFADLAKLSAVKADRVPVVITRGSTNLKPVRFTVGTNVRGLVMPVRIT